MLKEFIKNYLNLDKSRSSKSNLIKLLISDNSKFEEINNFILFGTFKQKLFHYLEDTKVLPKCLLCESNVNWNEKDFKYRETCSSKCSGKLNLVRNSPIFINHTKLESKEDYYNYFISGKLKITESSINKYYPEVIEYTKSINFVDDFKQKVYCYLKDIKSIPICKHCNLHVVEFENFSKGYREFCSIKCSSNSEQKKNKIINTNLEKYNVENISSVTRDKALETMLEKYGSHISLTTQYKNKYKNTSIGRYNVDHPFKSNIIKKKISDSNYIIYGGHPMKNSKVIEKVLMTKKSNGTIFKWSDIEVFEFEMYRRRVNYLTEKNYQKFKDEINPNNYNRGHLTYHLDHIYPVILGFINKVSVEDISNKNNLQILTHFDNRSKGRRTEMSLEYFFNLIKK
jgi:hypothetical protein